MTSTSPGSSSRLVPQTDRYQIVERLGEGGMAVVYRAVDNQERRWCALKVLLPQFRGNKSITARFVAEARAMAALKHRNTIEVYDVQVDGPEPYFVMELATGGSLIEWLQDHGPMPARMAVDVTIQLCKALSAAHEQGLVHRDVKPHNVLVNRRGTVKLIDFGIARHEAMDGLTLDGSGMGTLGYIAPEQKDEASTVDGRADVYSVGATLHTLLCARTLLDLYLADQEPEMLEMVPEPLRPVIVRATRYRASERYQTMKELAKALYDARSALDEAPPDTPPLVTRPDRDETEDLERFLSRPSAAVPDEVAWADNEATGSHPSISRDALLRPQEEVVEARVVEALNWRALALGSLPLWALILAIVGLTFMRGGLLRQSNDIVAAYEQRLDGTLAAESAVVDDLIRLGGDADRLRHTWRAVQSNSGRRRVEHAYTFTLLAQQEYEENEPVPGSPMIHVARATEQRLKRLREATEAARAARAQDDGVRSDAMSSFAVRAGIAPPPLP